MSMDTEVGGVKGDVMTLNSKQLGILQHALGVDQHGQGPMYRNHFCAGEGDEAICRELVALGAMQQHRTTDLLPYFNCSVTEAGRQAVRDQSPPPPKLTRSQKRYRAFLDEDCGESFGTWLKWQNVRRLSATGGYE